MKKDVKVNKGRFAVIKDKTGRVIRTVEATKGLRIEGNDIEVVSKTKSQLNKAETDKIKKK
jgi:hypothetical protein